jgi:hypothetical protein
MVLVAPAAARGPGAHAASRKLHKHGGVPAQVETVAAGTIGVQSSVGYTFDDGSVEVDGELLNNSSYRQQYVNVTAHFFDAGDVEIASASEFADIAQIGRGATAPFLVRIANPPPGIVNYALEIDEGTHLTAAVAGVLAVIDVVQSADGDSQRFDGVVENKAAFTIANHLVTITAYDAFGEVLWVDFVQGFGAATVPAGGQAAFSLFVPNWIAFARVAFTAQAFDAATVSKYVTSWNNYFDDIGTSSFRPDIIWIAEAGITTGCGAGRYCPTSDVSREQMAAFLARSLGLGGDAPDAFTDDESSPYEASINRIAREGIATGCGTALFCPTANVTRGQMASFLARALNLGGAAPDAFTDDETSIHEANINLVARDGITAGCGGTNYCPLAFVSRGQMAAFLHRAFD